MKAPLFEAQATGGVVARGGFEYQDAYLQQHFPQYLAQSAFSHAVSELLGDIEVRYHRPTGGTYCVLYEAKGYQLSEKDFWGEIDRFAELHGKAPDEYVRFVLVCSDYLNKLTAMFNKLDRLRGPGASLNTNSTFRASAEADVRLVRYLQPGERGRWLCRHVGHALTHGSGHDWAGASHFSDGLQATCR